MGEKILLVDDEAGIRKVLGIALADSGYQVLVAENGNQALEIFRAEQPPIVLTDIKMPGIDGIELLRIIKRERPDTEVIMISGHGDLDLAIKSLKLEATDFITKPINDDVLEIALGRAHEKIRMRRLLQEALRGTRERYQRLFDEVPCYISVQDRDLKLTAVNRRFKEDFGDAPDAYCYEVFGRRSDPCPGCIVAATFEDGRSHHAEKTVTSRSGRRYTVMSWTAPLHDAEGNITQVMEMSTNVTEIRRLQNNLTSLGLMVGSISHGIKGVLTGLDAGLYLLESGLQQQDVSRIDEGLEVTRMMTDRIRDVVLNILQYAKQRALDCKEVAVTEFVQDVLAVVEPKIDPERIRFVCRVDDSAGRFQIDAPILRSAFVNILENAIEACMEGDSGERHQITFTVGAAEETLCFDVRDDGVGMDEETRQKVFTLFFSSKGTMGTGLGLFIARKNIEQHGGAITLHSAPGQGSHFQIVLPRIFPPSARLETPTSADCGQ